MENDPPEEFINLLMMIMKKKGLETKKKMIKE
jgi:hypothetical protein